MKRLLAVCLIALLLSGCGFLRKSALKLSQEDVKNIETARVIAKNCLSTWLFKSGFIRKSLGVRISILTAEAIEAMDELDTYAEKYKTDPDTVDDKELGGTLGSKVLILSDVVTKALELYAPDVLRAMTRIL